MSITRKSMYAAFGNKAELFRKAMERLHRRPRCLRGPRTGEAERPGGGHGVPRRLGQHDHPSRLPRRMPGVSGLAGQRRLWTGDPGCPDRLARRWPCPPPPPVPAGPDEGYLPSGADPELRARYRPLPRARGITLDVALAFGVLAFVKAVGVLAAMAAEQRGDVEAALEPSVVGAWPSKAAADLAGVAGEQVRRRRSRPSGLRCRRSSRRRRLRPGTRHRG